MESGTQHSSRSKAAETRREEDEDEDEQAKQAVDAHPERPLLSPCYFADPPDALVR